MMFTFQYRAQSSVPTPPAGKATYFTDVADGLLKRKDPNGTFTTLGGVQSITLNGGSPLSGNVALDGFFDGIGQLTAQSTLPPSASAGRCRVFARSIGGRIIPAWIGPRGLDTMAQPNLLRNYMWTIRPTAANATTLLTQGITAPTVLGTATARAYATTNLLTRQTRIGFVSGAAAGNTAGYNVATNPQNTMGRNNQGGFWFVSRFAITDAALQSGARMFVGLANILTAPANVALNTLTQHIGLGRDTADANLRVYYGGTATLQSVDCGSNFAHANMLNVPLEFSMFSSPLDDGTSISWRLERLDAGVFVDGVITGTAGAQLPAETITLAPRVWRMTTAAAAVAIDIAVTGCECDV